MPQACKLIYTKADQSEDKHWADDERKSTQSSRVATWVGGVGVGVVVGGGGPVILLSASFFAFMHERIQFVCHSNS